MQRINDKLKSLCKFCSSNLDKPCAWISLGNEYCDRIMNVQNELDNRNEIISKAIGHINACKTNLGNYVLSPSETECLLRILENKE